ncbi:MAG: hypothetical protein ACOZF0_15170 [Thermodesulfobacteriota bacterium]
MMEKTAQVKNFSYQNVDKKVKSPCSVTPAKAGSQNILYLLDAGSSPAGMNTFPTHLFQPAPPRP